MADSVQQESNETTQVPCKVSIPTWRKIKYKSVAESLKKGRNITMSDVAGQLLSQAADKLPEPPAEMMGASAPTSTTRAAA